jgi:hypothetical protein
MQQLEQQPPEEAARKQAVWEKEQQEFEDRQKQQQEDMQQSLFTMVEMGPYEVLFLNQHVAGRLLDMLETWGSEDEGDTEGYICTVVHLCAASLTCLDPAWIAWDSSFLYQQMHVVRMSEHVVVRAVTGNKCV